MPAKKRTRMRKPCEACGYPADARVCRHCLRYYGGPPANAIAGAALARRMAAAKTHEEALAILGELCDYMTTDWPCRDLPRLAYTTNR